MVVNRTPTSAAIYTRISDDREGVGLGVERQEYECRQLAERQGWGVGEVYSDNDISATSGKRRPGYLRLLADIGSDARDGLLVWHPDRLHRPRSTELEGFIDLHDAHPIPILTVQSGDVDLTTASGRMVARIVGAVNRHESEHLAERMRSKHAELARSGKVGGGGRRAFGYEPDFLNVREDEAALIREAAVAVLAGESLGSVVRRWNDAAVPTVNGGRWMPATVRKILMSARICGWRSLRGELVAEAVWQPVIDLDTHRQLVAVLTDPVRDTRHGQVTARSYLLSGFLFCSCGAPMRAYPVVQQGRRYRRYVCDRRRGGCGSPVVTAVAVEDVVVRRVKLRAADPRVRAAVERRGGGAGSVHAAALEEIRARLDDLADMFSAGEIDRLEWARARVSLVERRDVLTRADVTRVRARAAGADVSDLAARWDGLSFDRQRAVLEVLVDRVVVGPAATRGPKFDPGRVRVVWRKDFT